MSQICPQCGNDLYATSAEHRCSDFVMPYMCKTTSIDPRDAQIAALTEKLRAVEAERDEWKRKYETQCAGSMSAHERRIHLEADLRAELERKAEKMRDVAYGLLDECKARLDKAEKVCEAFHRCRVISRVTKDGRTVTAIEDQARVQELYEAYTDYRRRKEIDP